MSNTNSNEDTSPPHTEEEILRESVFHAKSNLDDLLGNFHESNEGDPQQLRVKAAYYQGVLSALDWFEGEKSNNEIFENPDIEVYKPDDSEE